MDFIQSGMFWIILVPMGIVAVLVCFNLAVKFIWAPIRLHGANQVKAAYSGNPVDAQTLTPEMQEFFRQVNGRLVEMGFELVAFTGHDSISSADVRSAQALLVNRDTDDVAVVMIVDANTRRNLVYAIRTEFEDGGRLSTGFSLDIGFFPPNPLERSVTFAFVNDPNLTYQAHRRMLDYAGFADRPRCKAPAKGAEMQYLEWDWNRGLNWAAHKGYFWLDEPAGVYRKTWKGSFLAAWKLQSPIKQWRIALRDFRARRLWRELGMPPLSVQAAMPLLEPPDGTQEALSALPVVLGYETAVAEGDVHIERNAGTVIVRAGGPALRTFLWGMKGVLLSLLLFSFLAGTTFYHWWTLRRLLGGMAGTRIALLALRQRTPSPTLWLWLCLVGWEIALLVSNLRASRGAATIIASPAGLRFANTPRPTPDGTISRSQIEVLLVFPKLVSLRIWAYEIKVRVCGKAALKTLLSGRDKQSVENARDALAQAMGIENGKAADSDAINPTSFSIPVPL